MRPNLADERRILTGILPRNLVGKVNNYFDFSQKLYFQGNFVFFYIIMGAPWWLCGVWCWIHIYEKRTSEDVRNYYKPKRNISSTINWYTFSFDLVIKNDIIAYYWYGFKEWLTYKKNNLKCRVNPEINIEMVPR